MNSRTFRSKASSIFLSALLLLTFSARASAHAAAATQKREHLTPEEIDQIRDAQELDKRTAIFVKAAERRLLTITDPPAAAKQFQDVELWGTLKGTRAQLLTDLSRILDEAETNIEDTAARDPKSSLPHKSLRLLADAAARFLPRLAPLRESATNEGEHDSIDELIAASQEIVEAAKNHPVVEEDKAGAGKEKSKKKKTN